MSKKKNTYFLNCSSQRYLALGAFLFVLTIIVSTSSSALTLGDVNTTDAIVIERPQTSDQDINYSTVNVNNSQYLQGYTPTTLRDWMTNLFNLTYLKNIGGKLYGDLDMNGNSITNVGSLTGIGDLNMEGNILMDGYDIINAGIIYADNLYSLNINGNITNTTGKVGNSLCPDGQYVNGSLDDSFTCSTPVSIDTSDFTNVMYSNQSETINGNITIRKNLAVYGNLSLFEKAFDNDKNLTSYTLQIGTQNTSEYNRAYPSETSGIMYPMFNISIGNTRTIGNNYGLQCVMTDSVYRPFRCGWGRKPDYSYYGHILDIAGAIGVESYTWAGNSAAFIVWSSAADIFTWYTGTTGDWAVASYRFGKVYPNLIIDGATGNVGINWNGSSIGNYPPQKLTVNGTIWVNEGLQLINETIPLCNATYSGYIKKNATKIYYCENAKWNDLYDENQFYASMFNKSDDGFEIVDLVTTDVYVQIRSLKCGELNGFSCVNGTGNITTLVAGLYEIIPRVAVEQVSASGDDGMKVFINEVGKDECYDHEHTSANPIGFIAPCQVRLNVGDKITIRFDDHSVSPQDIKLVSANIGIKRIGN